MIQIFGLSRCKATRAAQRFFAERSVKVQFIDLAQKNMAKGELQSVARAVGGVAAVYDGGGARAKERGLQHLDPNEARMTSLLLEDAQLFRTPVVRNGPQATVGPAEETWKGWVAALKQGVLPSGVAHPRPPRRGEDHEPHHHGPPRPYPPVSMPPPPPQGQAPVPASLSASHREIVFAAINGRCPRPINGWCPSAIVFHRHIGHRFH